MRFIVGLLLLGGAIASSDLFYPANQELQYDYEGKILTGIPKLDSHYAGMTIRAKVILQTQDGQHFKLALQEPQYVNYNEKLSGPHPQNWRTVQTPQTQQVPAEQRRFLESPVAFTMTGGKVRNVQISADEPQWSNNFKKGLVALFKVQTNDRDQQQQGQQSPVEQAIQQGAAVQSWKIMEEDLVGICEHDYLYTEIPRANLPEVDRQLLERASAQCQSGKIFKVEKTRNIDRCVQRAVYMLNQPGYYDCLDGNCPGMWDRSSMTKIIGCKQSSGRWQVQAVVNEGEIQQTIFGEKMENLVSGVKQTLVLKQAGSQLSSLPQISSPKQQDEIFYEHTKPLSMVRGQQGSSGGRWSPKNLYEQQQQLKNEESNPRQQRYAFTLPQGDQRIESEIAPQKVQQRALQLIEEIVQNLGQHQDFKSTLTSSKTLSLTDLISLMSTQEIQSLWQSVESASQSQEKKSQMRQIVWETSIVCGSNPAIMFAIEAAQKGQVSDLQIKEAIISFPYYMRTPTQQIIKELFQFIRSPSATKTQYMKALSHVAFATVLNQACMTSRKGQRFGEYTFGEFCNAKNSELTSQYIPFFAQQLEAAQTETEKIHALFPLGTIGHESAISLILPYVEGKKSGATPQVQRMAIYALNVVAVRSRSKLLPVLSSLVKNQYEDRYVRIAALTMALTAKPELTFFQNLAASTWYEEDVEFQKFVLSTLRSLGQLNSHPRLADEDLRATARFAQAVLPMARPQPGVISSQMQAFTDQWMQIKGIGHQSQAYMTSLLSTKSIYVKIEYLLQRLRFRPLEFAADISGLENGDLMQKLKQDLVHESVSGSGQSSELSNILQQLDVKPYTGQPMMLNLWVRLLNDMNIVTVVREQDAQKITDFIKSSLSGGSQGGQSGSLQDMVCGQSQVNLVKVNDVARYQLLTPSEMGIPIVSETRMPVVAKISGQVDVQCGSDAPSVQAELETKLAANFIGYVSTYSPFTKDWISTGVDKQVTMNSPTKTRVALGSDGLKIKLMQSEALKASGASTVDLLHYSIRPFAVIKPITYLDTTPMNAHRNIKFISSGAQQKQRQYPVGQALGLDLNLNQKTENDVVDLKSVQEIMRLYNYNPINMLLFGFTHSGIKMNGSPSVRFHETSLVLNPQSSSTKEAEFDIKMAFGRTHQSKKEELQVVRKSGKIAVETKAISGSSKVGQKLQESLEKLSVKSGYAVSLEVKAQLTGAETKTAHYTLTAGQGRNDAEQKWNVDIVNQNNQASRWNLCMNGKLSLPSLPWTDADQIQSQDTQFAFYNKAGFGQSCSENHVTVTGSTQVSDHQISKSKSSGDRQKCREAKHKLDKIAALLKKAIQKRDYDQRNRLEQEEIRQIKKISQFCKKQMKLASVLDQVNFRINYELSGQQQQSQQQQQQVYAAMQYVDNAWEGYMLPYLYQTSQRQNQQNQVNVQMQFHPEAKTFDVDVETPQRSLTYKGVRVPSALRKVLPMNARSRPSMQVFKAVSGGELYPKCTLINDVITTYDNRSYSYHLDDCYHLAVADCSNTQSHGVLVKEVDGKKQVKLYVKNMQVEAKAQQANGQEYQVTVNGQQQSLSGQEKREFTSQDGQVHIQVQKTPDNWLVIDTPYSRVILNPRTVEIEKNDVVLAGQHCGLCGNHDGDRKGDVKDAKQCVAKTPRAAALSYRLERSCSSISDYKKKIRDTEQVCLPKKVEKTPVTSFIGSNGEFYYPDSTGSGSGSGSQQQQQCSQLRHKIVVQGREHCISQVRILECEAGCVAKGGMTSKSIGFTCLPADRPRLVELYEEKVRRGEYLPELKSMDTRFSKQMNLPLSCGQPSN